MTEMTVEVAGSAEAVVDFQEEDRLLAEAEALAGVTDQCSMLPVVTVENHVKFLLDQQMANRFIAVIVLRKREMEEVIPPDLKGLNLELQVLTKKPSLTH